MERPRKFENFPSLRSPNLHRRINPASETTNERNAIDRNKCALVADIASSPVEVSGVIAFALRSTFVEKSRNELSRRGIRELVDFGTVLSQLSLSSITVIRFASQTRGGSTRAFSGKDEGGWKRVPLVLVLFTIIVIIIIIRHRIPPAETREILNPA